MKTIHLNQCQARMLRRNITDSSEGYDYINLQILDFLAKKINGLLGDYGEEIAKLALKERQIRRKIARATSQVEVDAGGRQLAEIGFEVEDLDEVAKTVEVDVEVEDGHYNLIKDKIDSQERWVGSDAYRETVLGMIAAVKNAESNAEGAEPVNIRKHGRG